MFLCHLLVVFLLGTVANGMTASDPTTHSTTDYVSTLGGSTASTSEAPGTPSPSPTTTSSTSTPSQQGTTTVLSTTLETSDSPPSPTTTQEQSTTTVKSTTESTTDESTTTLSASTTTSTETGSTPSVSTSVTTEMMSSPLPTESTTTHSATTLEVSDTTVSGSASSSTTSPVDVTSTPHSGTTLSSETTKTSLPSTTMTDHTTETTGLTHSTEPTSGIIVSTTVSSSTVLTTTDNTISTVNPTSTTMRPTDITNNSTTTMPQTTTPIPPFIECPATPCPVETACLDGTCQCISGTFLQNGRCTPAQVFPGQLHLTSLTFQSEMSDRTSAIFLNTAANISAALRVVFENEPGYIQSDVVKLTQGSVQATVNNIFEDTNATQDSVDELVKQAINSSTDGLLAQATYNGTSLCDQEPTPCDALTTTCSLRDGRASCTCRPGYIIDTYSTLSCRPCPSGYRKVEVDKCEPCPFGYSGFNCDDSALLAVVVISCVLGGVLLIMVLSLLIYCIWRNCSNGKTEYNNSPYPVEAFSGSLSSQGITPIPRATTKWDAAPPIEMTEGGSTHNLVDKNSQTNGGTGSYDLNPDRMKTFTGKNPSRYSYLVQGHENPYFLPGDDKRN